LNIALKPLPLRWSLIAIIVLGVLLASLVAARQPTTALRIVFPAIEGDAVLVITPSGHTLLIDGGTDGAATATWLGQHMPFAQRRIDALVLTRPDERTLPGQLAAIKRYEIGAAFVAASEQQNSQFAAWWQALDERGTAVQPLERGNNLHLGACLLDVLTANAGRATLALRCNATSAYFLQAIDTDAEAELADVPLPRATLAVYPWERATDSAVLQHLQPSALVFSESGENDLRQSFAQRRVGTAQLFHEAVHGELTFTDDGQQLRVHTERKEEP
jgi:beta-lactamase superfamily II metal-dependent hydrolase